MPIKLSIKEVGARLQTQMLYRLQASWKDKRDSVIWKYLRRAEELYFILIAGSDDGKA